MSDQSTVGVIGLGVMGSALTQSLLESGFTVVGYDIDPAKLRRHTLAGGRSARSPLDVAKQVRTTLTSLPSVSALEALFSGDQGLLSAASLEDLVLIETSTLPLAAKFWARDTLAASGAVVLDRPLSGSGAQARTRDVVVYVSGDAEVATMRPGSRWIAWAT
jgi:L-threonate 2-dehydrogenase